MTNQPQNLLTCLQEAESLAHEYGEAFIRTKNGSDFSVTQKNHPDDDLKVTHIKRFKPSSIGQVISLAKATEFVMFNLPEHLKLDEQVVVERYPQKRFSWNSISNDSSTKNGVSNIASGVTPSIFAYQFFTTDGLNIATWMPDLSDISSGPTMISGYRGEGRQYDPGMINEKKNIRDLIDLEDGKNELRNHPYQNTKIADIYDSDSSLRSSLYKVYKDTFEYPDFSHKTIGRIVEQLPKPLMTSAKGETIDETIKEIIESKKAPGPKY